MSHAEQTQSAPAKPPPGTSSIASFEDPASRGRSLLEISNEMVRIYKEQFGRGPTKARTHYAGPDVLVCLLEHTLTPAERNLQRLGEHERLQDMRMFFQYAQTATFTEPIERITGRRVRAFISGLDTNADIASELFVLEPDLPRETPHDPSGAEETEPTGTLSKTRRSVSPHSRIADRHRPDATEEPKSQLS